MGIISSGRCGFGAQWLPTTVAAALLILGLPVVRARPESVDAPSPASGASSYSITDLGPVADVADEQTLGLNRSGDVCLYGSDGDHVHAALWSQGRRTDLKGAPGYPNAVCHALNRHGTVVGWTNTSDNPVDSLSTTRAFVSDGKGIRVLGTLGGRDSRALGVNDAGRIVGVASVDSQTRHAFAYDGAELKDLGVLPGGKFSAAYAVNAAGDAAGVADTAGHINHPVRWHKGKIQDLGVFPGGGDGRALAINARGDVAGYCGTADGIHAFLYSRGHMRDLGVLRFDPSTANGLNDRGEVVGTSNISASGRHAFLWRKGRMDDLNDLVPRDSGWILSGGCAINNAGQIVCTAERKGEPLHAVLLTPKTRLDTRSP